MSDVPAIMEPARELNRAFSQLSMILELSGNPIAVLENIEDAQDITVQPGAVWEVPESSRAYLLDLLQGGGVRLHTEFIDLVYRALHDLSESPRPQLRRQRPGPFRRGTGHRAEPAGAEGEAQEADPHVGLRKAGAYDSQGA